MPVPPVISELWVQLVYSLEVDGERVYLRVLHVLTLEFEVA